MGLCQLPLMNSTHATLAHHMGKVTFQLSIKCFLYCTLKKMQVVGILARLIHVMKFFVFYNMVFVSFFVLQDTFENQ